MFSQSRQACKHMFLVYRWHGDVGLRGHYAAQTIPFNNASLLSLPTPPSDPATTEPTIQPTTTDVTSPMNDLNMAKRQLSRAISQAHIRDED